jgi:hypothetical protein
MKQTMKATLVTGIITGFTSQLPWLLFLTF